MSETELPESLEKAKRPRSQKQIETFKKAQEKRKQNCELMKEVKEQQEAQRKLEQIKIKEEILKKKIIKPTPPPSAEPSREAESDDEPEIVIVKKPKKKKIVVVEPESEDEEEATKPIEKQRAAEPLPQIVAPKINKLSFY